MNQIDILTDALNRAVVAGDEATARELASTIAATQAQQAGQSVAGQGPANPESVMAPYSMDKLTYAWDRFKGNLSQISGALQIPLGALEQAYKKLGLLQEDRVVPTPEEAQRGTQEALGYQGLRPVDMTQQALGGAVSALTDPTTYALGPGGIVRKAFTGMMGGIGGEVGGEMGGTVGGILGGGVAGAGADLLGLGSRTAVNFGAKQIGKIAGQGKEAAQAVAEEEARQSVQNIFQAAAAADPAFVTTIREAEAQAKALGVDLPTAVLAGHNPVIDTALASLAVKDADFANKIKKQFETAQMQLKEKVKQIYGDTAEGYDVLAKLQNAKPFEAAVGRRLDQYGKERGIATDKVAFGFNEADDAKRIAAIRAGEKDPISPQADQLYAKTFRLAEEQKAKIKGTTAQGLRSFVNEKFGDDPFKNRFPQVFSAINNKIKSKAVDMGDGVTTTTTDALDMVDIDSLKREVNRAIRDTDSRADIRILAQLKNEIDRVMQADLPPEVYATYKRADDAFALGAMAQSFARQAIVDGKIDAKKARLWFEDNADAIKNVPGLDEKVGEAAEFAARMQNKEEKLFEQFKTAVAEQEILGNIKMTPSQLTNRLRSDPLFRDQFLKRYGGLSGKPTPETKAVQSIVINDLLSSRDALGQIENDPETMRLLGRVMGVGWKPQVLRLAELTESLSMNPADVRFDIKAGVPKDFAEKLTGIPAPQIISRYRNQIISTFQATVELVSKSLTAKSSQITDQRMMTALLDPQTLKTYVDDIAKIQATGTIDDETAKGLWALAKKLGITVATDTGRATAAGAIVGGRTANDRSDQRISGEQLFQ